MWNTYQRLVMRTSPPSEKYEIFSPLPLPTLLISHPLLWRGLGRLLGLLNIIHPVKQSVPTDTTEALTVWIA